MDEELYSSKTWNGAVSFATTGTDKFGKILDYWFKAGTYQSRSIESVHADMDSIFSDDEQVALAVVFGLRLITRKPNLDILRSGVTIDETQTGYGRRDEFFKAIVWLHQNRNYLLYDNLHLIPVFGSWKDFLVEPLISVLDRKKVYQLFADNIDNDLLLKYLPQIRSVSQVGSKREKKRSNWAKGFCHFMKITPKEYRQLKSSGKAHIFQKQISSRDWYGINFNGIPGKAMLNFTSRKGRDKKTIFERHGLVEYLIEWVDKQKSVKFTGYPYQLTQAASIHKRPSLLQKFIYDKQFEAMIDPMRGHGLGNVLCAIDTSGSMTCPIAQGVTAYDVCISMGLTFSYLNCGYFKNVVAKFDKTSKLMNFVGNFTDRLHQIESMTTAVGCTNFQSLIDLLVCVRKNNPEIPVEEYPETLLILSDMQFNPAGRNTESNYEAAMRKLKAVGLQDIRIIWWCLNGAIKDFPARMNDRGVYLIGGFDPVNLKSLMGLNAEKKDFVAKEKKEETPLDGLKNFLSQPIFSLLTVY